VVDLVNGQLRFALGRHPANVLREESQSKYGAPQAATAVA